LKYPGGTTATYGFDYADRPKSVNWGSSQIVSSATYEPFGPIASIVFGNGTTQALSYNQRYQPTENKLTGGTTIADYLYAEDGVGNITQITDNVNAGYDRSFGPYDDLNRLTTANSGASLWGTASGNGYTYDKMGNILSITLGTAHTATFSYSGTLPKLTSVTDSTQNGGAAQTITYDLVGNEPGIGAHTYTYSARNLLATGDGFTYTYDSRGVRTTTSGSPGTRYSLYNSDLSLLSESSLTSNSMIYNYVWFAGRPIAQVNTSGGTSIYSNFTDHLGTPEIQTNSSGAVNWQAEYEPYGRVFALRAGDVHQPLRLPGQVAEQFDTGANGTTPKSYNLFRWNHFSWSRFTQIDLLQELPTAIVPTSNEYSYADGRPDVGTDPYGLWNVWNPATWGVTGGNYSLLDSLNPYGESASWSGWFPPYNWKLTGEADAAFLDGVNPFGKPLLGMGLYDPCDTSLQISQNTGRWSRNIELSLAPLGLLGYAEKLPFLGRASLLFGKGGLLNNNDLFRVGWGYKYGYGSVFRAVVGGNETPLGQFIRDLLPPTLSHFDFYY
jgi:hypothetical protein